MQLDILPAITNPFSTKEHIISLLSKEWPLSAKEIYSRIQKSGKTQSYQAVHKVLGELNSQRILEKKGKKYSLSFDWLEKEVDELSKIKQKYTGKIEKIIVNKYSDNPQRYKFDTFSELGVALAELFASDQIEEKNNKLIGIFQLGYATFNFSFKDIKLLKKVSKKNPEMKSMFQKDTPFGRWTCKLYNKAKVDCVILGTDIYNEDIICKGDYIAQITFSKKTKKILENEFNKIKNIEELFKKFVLKKEPKIDTNITITKNPALAKIIGDQLREIYKNAMKKEKKK